jgi:hypothetical protein
MLGRNTALKMLDLKPQIRLHGVRALSFAIKDNSALERLKFSLKPEKELK